MARYTVETFGDRQGAGDRFTFEALNDLEAVQSVLSLCDGRRIVLCCGARVVRAWGERRSASRPASGLTAAMA